MPLKRRKPISPFSREVDVGLHKLPNRANACLNTTSRPNRPDNCSICCSILLNACRRLSKPVRRLIVERGPYLRGTSHQDVQEEANSLRQRRPDVLLLQPLLVHRVCLPLALRHSHWSAPQDQELSPDQADHRSAASLRLKIASRGPGRLLGEQIATTRFV